MATSPSLVDPSDSIGHVKRKIEELKQLLTEEESTVQQLKHLLQGEELKVERVRNLLREEEAKMGVLAEAVCLAGNRSGGKRRKSTAPPSASSRGTCITAVKVSEEPSPPRQPLSLADAPRTLAVSSQSSAIMVARDRDQEQIVPSKAKSAGKTTAALAAVEDLAPLAVLSAGNLSQNNNNTVAIPASVSSSSSSASTRDEDAEALLRLLKRRRAEEWDFWQKNCSHRGSMRYIADQAWFERWRSFAHEGGPPPGPISNSSLLDGAGRPLPGLRGGKDWAVVNEPMWLFWHGRHGGGPALPRSTGNLYRH